MTISQALKKGQEVLKQNSQTPELDSELLLCFALNVEKAYLYTHPDKTIPKSKIAVFEKALGKRAEGTPIAYITKSKEFYSLPFYIDENVLIPRPETEQLVDLILEFIRNSRKKETLRIIDVGTGCGNIAIASIVSILDEGLNNRSRIDFYLSDISGKALKVARRNYQNLISNPVGINVSFVKTDLLKGFENCFDIIVSNPPYIPQGQIDYLDPSVREFEPRLSLDGGRGGIVIVRRLIDQAVEKLCEDGVCMFEMHEKHPNIVKYYILEKYSQLKVEFQKDCFESWRFAIVRK